MLKKVQQLFFYIKKKYGGDSDANISLSPYLTSLLDIDRHVFTHSPPPCLYLVKFTHVINCTTSRAVSFEKQDARLQFA